MEITLANYKETVKVGDKIIGVCTGMDVIGVVTAIDDSDKYSLVIEYDFVEPKTVQWGNDHYTHGEASFRKCDGWRRGNPRTIEGL